MKSFEPRWLTIEELAAIHERLQADRQLEEFFGGVEPSHEELLFRHILAQDEEIERLRELLTGLTAPSRVPKVKRPRYGRVDPLGVTWWEGEPNPA